MAAPALSTELIDQWADRGWRLNHLYHIEDAWGRVIPFRLNAAQEKLLGEMHFLNIVLKARQMGFSTFILILALDCALFNNHFSAGLVADTLDNAKDLLKRVKFAYERMLAPIRGHVTIETDNQTEIEFSNGSSIRVGVSLRSGTYNFIHISEYGKICAKLPDKAEEIKRGALNTLAPRQLAFIESTAEGKGGDFYEKTRQARAIIDAQRKPRDMEYRFHFFPWFEDPKYYSDEEFPITAELEAYFEGLRDEHGIELSYGQRWWYAMKVLEQGDGMKSEFPSTPDEAFEGARDGAYFAKDIRNLRQRGHIGKFPFESRTPVNTFWDLGTHDSTVIWLHQLIAGRHRFVGYYEHSGEGMTHYLGWLDKWAVRHSARFGEHFGPHDIEHKKQGITAQSIRQISAELGYKFQVVQRTPDKLNSIQNVRSVLPQCEFDEAACAEGIEHMEAYSREWDDKYAVWKPRPRHDEHSHCADAFMTFADGYHPPATNVPGNLRQFKAV